MLQNGFQLWIYLTFSFSMWRTWRFRRKEKETLIVPYKAAQLVSDRSRAAALAGDGLGPSNKLSFRLDRKTELSEPASWQPVL